MKAVSVFFTLLGMAIAASGQYLVDEFNDNLLDGSFWSSALPNAWSDWSESGDVLELVNQGTIITREAFPRSRVQGRIRFTGTAQDSFNIYLRSDGQLGDPNNIPHNSISIGIRTSDFLGSSAELASIMRSSEFGDRPLAEVSTEMEIRVNEWIEFVVEDDGSLIKVYVQDLDTAAMEIDVEEDFGGLICFGNRNRQEADCVTEIDRLQISSALPSRKIEIDRAHYYMTAREPGLQYQLVSRSSPDSNDWQPVGEVIHGVGTAVYGFARGHGPEWLPSRAWRVTESGDNRALEFDGTDDFAFHAHTPELNLSSGMTLEAWVKPAAGGYPGVIMAKGLSPSVLFYSLELDGTGRAVYRALDINGSEFIRVVSDVALPVDAWTHVAGTYNGSEAALYLNGILDAGIATTGSVMSSPQGSFLVGSVLGSYAYGGLVDELRIWGIGRTATAIAGAFQSSLTGSEPGLAATWSISGESSQALMDSGDSGLHLTLGLTDSEESFDPTWVDTSFPGRGTYQMIWNFGSPWYLVHWDSVPGWEYTLDRAEDLAGGDWTAVWGPSAAPGTEMAFFPLPGTDESAASVEYAAYRVRGPVDPLLAGLVAYFPLDGNALDASGNGHHGTERGALLETNGVHGTALQFTGAGFVQIADHPALNPTQFTVSAWVKSESVTGVRGIFAKCLSFAPTYYRLLLLPGPEANLSIEISHDFDGSIWTDFGQELGKWTLVTASYDGERTRLYVNQALKGEVYWPRGPLISPEDIIIGAGAWTSSGGGATQIFVGAIDDLRFYNRVLPADEVATLYMQGEAALD